MMPDTVGRGNSEGDLPPSLAAVQRVASNGYVRSRLYVVPGGGAGAGGASETAMAATELSGQAVAVGGGTSLVQAFEARSVETTTTLARGTTRAERVRQARMKGYEGDSCGECGNFTLVRNGTCLKCDTCGSTSGCS